MLNHGQAHTCHLYSAVPIFTLNSDTGYCLGIKGSISTDRLLPDCIKTSNLIYLFLVGYTLTVDTFAGT